MKKFFIIPALLSVLIFMLCGCDTVPNTSSGTSEIMIPLFEPDIDFSIPESFSQTSTENNNTAYICENASIIVNEDKLTESVPTLSAYATYSKETYQKITDSFEIISEDKNQNINGLDSTVIEFNYGINDENDTLSMTCMVGFYCDPINRPGKIFIVTCKSDSESYPDYKDDFFKTIKSVNLNQGSESVD